MRLKEDLITKLALMHKYGIITVLTFSKYASTIFAQRKPNGNLRLLVDLRKINTLIPDDYTINNHPVSTLSDAAHHFVKSMFSINILLKCFTKVLITDTFIITGYNLAKID